jgi:hypothetical protein
MGIRFRKRIKLAPGLHLNEKCLRGSSFGGIGYLGTFRSGSGGLFPVVVVGQQALKVELPALY